MIHSQNGKKKSQATETYGVQEVGINKYLKAAFINICKELKETMPTEVKEAMMAMSHQIEEDR